MKFVNKKVFSLCLVLCMVVAPLNVTAAAAEIPESGRLDTETEVSIGTPIYACPAEDAEEIMLDDIDAIAAVAGYASVEAPENASRKYTRNDEGIIRTVIVGDDYVMVSSLDTMHGYPVGACYLVPVLACTGEEVFDIDSGMDLFI